MPVANDPVTPELKEKVKIVALQIGVREAARAFELSEERVMKWSQREGWLANHALVAEAKEIAIQRKGLSAAVRKTPQEIMSKLGQRSKLRGAKVGDKMLAAIGRREEDRLIASSGAYLNTVNALAKVHGWGQEGTGSMTQVNVNIAGVRYEEA